jgi:hypothetical protein
VAYREKKRAKDTPPMTALLLSVDTVLPQVSGVREEVSERHTTDDNIDTLPTSVKYNSCFKKGRAPEHK